MYGHCNVIISSFSQKSRVPYGGKPSAAWGTGDEGELFFSIDTVIIRKKKKTLFYSECFCLGQGIEMKGEKIYNSGTIKETMLIKIQPDATVCRYLFTAKSLYMFRVSQHPSSVVL